MRPWTRNLRELEREGFTLRAPVQAKRLYGLSELGSMLFPPFHALAAVGEKLQATRRIGRKPPA
jgi:DNA-binding HxlR family transcriptional regulator